MGTSNARSRPDATVTSWTSDVRAELEVFTTGYSFHSKPPTCGVFRGVNLLNPFDVQPHGGRDDRVVHDSHLHDGNHRGNVVRQDHVWNRGVSPGTAALCRLMVQVVDHHELAIPNPSQSGVCCRLSDGSLTADACQYPPEARQVILRASQLPA